MNEYDMIGPVGFRNDKVLDYSIMTLGCTDLNTLAAPSPSPWDMHQWPNELELNLNKSLQCGKDVPAKLQKIVFLQGVVGRVFDLIIWKGLSAAFVWFLSWMFLGHPVPCLVE